MPACARFITINYQLLTINYFDLHSEQGRAQCLSLGIGFERDRSSPAEALMQQKIERMQIRQFETFDFALADAGEVFLDTLSRDLPDKKRIILGFESDQTDIRSVTFVTRTRVCDFEKLDFHVAAYLI
jgi:hypothetical protein